MTQIQDLSARDVADRMKQGAVLIDVREPAEFDAEHIEGAKLFPLSTFDPNRLPKDVPLIFNCGIGKRSAMAVARTQQAGYAHDTHLAGGLAAWKAAGLPTVVGKK
ncbi:MAG TPA: rhodanese-like domain-containing protein [Dongiaceae bacterium]|jgi:rhodanese-related sulfurtransferase|nr:rhodanese-like domain-containing protein [Dongiaceae bacterium]